jgi:hypothetical protein
MTLPDHIPNAELRLDQIPTPDADWSAIHTLAYTFHGYEHYGEFGTLAYLANHRLANTLSEARACLFFEHRRRVHSPEAFDNPERQAWLRELVRRIRSFVAEGRLE